MNLNISPTQGICIKTHVDLFSSITFTLYDMRPSVDPTWWVLVKIFFPRNRLCLWLFVKPRRTTFARKCWNLKATVVLFPLRNDLMHRSVVSKLPKHSSRENVAESFGQHFHDNFEWIRLAFSQHTDVPAHPDPLVDPSMILDRFRPVRFRPASWFRRTNRVR